MNSDLKILKKKYGENFIKLCRELYLLVLKDINNDFLRKYQELLNSLCVHS